MQIVKNTDLNCELQIIKSDNDIWFRGKTVCEYLGYKNTKDAISKHVREKHKKKLSEIRGPNLGPLSWN